MSDLRGLPVGGEVPEFSLDTFDPVSGDFGSVNLADLKSQGKWSVLFFYPADFTFVWATEFSALAELYDEFKSLNCEVITVSCDTKFVHLAWQREEGELANVKFPMGSDPTGAVGKMFGVYDDGSGLTLRGSFVISPEGKLMSSEVNFYNMGRNCNELLRKVRANIYLSQHGDQGCPAKWTQEGDQTLTPSAKVVGKVHEALNG